MNRALKTAFRCGVRPAEFWGLTPFETRLCIEASNDAVLDDCRRDLSLAWHTAWMHRVDAKHFPRLSELVKIGDKGGKPADAERPADDVGVGLMNALLQLPANIKRGGDAAQATAHGD